MTRTIRIQRTRRKGWCMPPDAVYVGRPSRWGNPFPWRGDWIVWAAVAAGYRADAEGRRAAAIAYYRQWLTGQVTPGPLANDQSGGFITYESGIGMSVAEAARSIAETCAMLHGGKITVPLPPSIDDVRASLRGKNLACFCPLDQPCHADVLLEIANGEGS